MEEEDLFDLQTSQYIPTNKEEYQVEYKYWYKSFVFYEVRFL